jgi:Arc/MetJ-type ribon-helix-helix transcriptional regulator
MKASGKIVVTLSGDPARQVRRLVEDEAFASPSAVMEEALRFWLQSRSRWVGRKRWAAAYVTRTFAPAEAPPPQSFGEPSERVELMFDAGDAKA